MKQTQRIDIFLVQKGLVRSRHLAQELINKNLVKIDSQIVLKSSHLVDDNLPIESIEILPNTISKFVSRGGAKLYSAFLDFEISAEGLKILDVGLSTGGFSDCALQGGARFVVGVDVGTSQVDSTLRNNPRLKIFENTDIREFKKLHSECVGFELALIDVSFVPLSLVLPYVIDLVKPGGGVLMLIKPQFELSAEKLGKGGIVKNEVYRQEALQKVTEVCISLGLELKGIKASAIKGSDGNQEHFLYAKKKISLGQESR